MGIGTVLEPLAASEDAVSIVCVVASWTSLAIVVSKEASRATTGSEGVAELISKGIGDPRGGFPQQQQFEGVPIEVVEASVVVVVVVGASEVVVVVVIVVSGTAVVGIPSVVDTVVTATELTGELPQQPQSPEGACAATTTGGTSLITSSTTGASSTVLLASIGSVVVSKVVVVVTVVVLVLLSTVVIVALCTSGTGHGVPVEGIGASIGSTIVSLLLIIPPSEGDVGSAGSGEDIINRTGSTIVVAEGDPVAAAGWGHPLQQQSFGMHSGSVALVARSSPSV